jgi:hypothetical protein
MNMDNVWLLKLKNEHSWLKPWSMVIKIDQWMYGWHKA